MRHRLLPIVLGFSLFAAACGDGGESSASAIASDPDKPASFDELDFSSPIGELLGFDPTDQDAMQQQFADMERKAEEIVGQCMRGQGFEYTPPISQSISFGGPFGQGDLPYYSDEWVDKFGFGISTMRFPQSAVGANLIGYPDEQFNDAMSEMPEDPNREYLESLSESEREAYEQALRGAGPSFDDPEQEGETFAFEPSGCYGEAFDEAFGDGPGGIGEEFFDTFGDELDALEERTLADPRVVKYRVDVSACVSDKGFAWSGDQEPYEYFEPKLEGIGPSGPMSDDPFEAAGLDPDEMSDRQLDELSAELDLLSDEDRAKLAAVQAEELELARVVVDCGGGYLNEQYFLGEVRREYEQEFLDKNADEIAALQAE